MPNGTHAKLSPSSAHRWMKCPASIGFRPSSESSPAADEGTAAHHFAEKVLSNFLSVEDVKGESHIVNNVAYICDGEIFNGVKMYTDYVNSFSGFLFAEYQWDISMITGETMASGTADCVIVDADLEEIHIFDFKFGRREVPVKGNWQLLTYLMAVLESQELKKFDPFEKDFKLTLHIIQPRVRNSIKRWDLFITDLASYRCEIQDAASRANYVLKKGLAGIGRGFFNPSLEACKYCAGKYNCSARVEYYYKCTQKIKGKDPDGSDYEIALFARDVANDIIGKFKEKLKDKGKINGYTLTIRTGRKWWKPEFHDLVEVYLKKHGLLIEKIPTFAELKKMEQFEKHEKNLLQFVGEGEPTYIVKKEGE